MTKHEHISHWMVTGRWNCRDFPRDLDVCIYIYTYTVHTYILGMHQCYESAKACSKKSHIKHRENLGGVCVPTNRPKIVIGFSLDDKKDIAKVEFLFDRVVAAATVRTSVDVPCRNNVLRAWGLNSEILILIKETDWEVKRWVLADQSEKKYDSLTPQDSFTENK